MSRHTLIASLALAAAIASPAADITTTTGEVLKNATVYDSNPYDLTIGYTDPDGWTIMKSVPFTILPEELRKHYGYSPDKAKAYEEERAKFLKKEADKEKQKFVILDDMPKTPVAAAPAPSHLPPQWQDSQNPCAATPWRPSPKPDTLATYVRQLTSAASTTVDKKDLWQKLRNKKVASSAVVLNVRKINWSSFENYWDGWGVAHIDTTSGWEVLVRDPQIQSQLAISLLCFNYDTARKLQKGQTITFNGDLWRFHGHTLYLNPVHFDGFGAPRD